MKMQSRYVQVKKFCAPGEENEFFLSVKPKSGAAFSQQVKQIEREYFNALAQLGITEDSVVHRKFFLSDILSQKDVIKKSPLYGYPVTNTKAAVSLIQQPPLSSCKICMFAYHLASKNRIQKELLFKNVLLLKRSDVSQLWSTNLIEPAPSNCFSSSAEQTKIVFEQLTKHLARFNATLKNNTIRTWLYVKQICKNYHHVTEGRRDFFYQQGLTPDTHFISSTGINGESEKRGALVSMDALSFLGVRKGQVFYLNAPDKLCKPISYNLTFERGVKISFNDRGHLYISGTASIDKYGKVVYKTDVIRQTARTFENIEALLNSGNAGLKDLMYIIVYLRNPKDAGLVEPYLLRKMKRTPYIIVCASVCRPEWLIEIEGMAIIKNNNANLPNF